MTRTARISYALLLAATAATATLSADAQVAVAQGRALLTDVEVSGVRSVDQKALMQGLATRPTECRTLLYLPICFFSRSPLFAVRAYLDPVEMRRDALRIRLFYWKRGYRDVAVTSRVERARGGSRVVFEVKENEPTVISRLDVAQSDTVLQRSAIDAALQLRAGDPLDLVAIDSSLTLLRNALWDRGYADARLTLDTSEVVNDSNAGAVTLDLDVGRLTTVRAINITGARAISERTIRRLLHLSAGDLYRRSSLLESQRDLYLSGLFSEVDLSAPTTSDSAKSLTLKLVEAPLRHLELSGGFTTADFLQLEAELTRYHFLGGARRLTVRGTVSNLLARQLNGAGPFYDVTNGSTGTERDPFLRATWAASLEFAQPWFLGASNQFGASIFTHRRSIPGVVTDNGVGATVAFTRELGSRSNATLGYTYEASRINASDVYFCVAVGLCVSSAIDVVSERHPLAPVSFVAQLDRSNNLFAPNRGVRARLDVEHASASTGSDFAYNRAALTASAYFRVTRRGVLATRARLGVVEAMAGSNRRLGVSSTEERVIHPRKLFFSGGSQSVRGYGENQLGPRVLTINPALLIADTSGTARCTNLTLAAGLCDPNAVGVKASAFQPRPLGGSALAEASVEFRFPLSVPAGLSGAVFVDGAIVGTRRFSNLLGATATITPGFGVRFDTPVGPVRLDLGIRPRVVEQLPVITQVTASDGTFQLVTLKTRRRYDQAEATGGALGQILSRLTLHLAIGPSF